MPCGASQRNANVASCHIPAVDSVYHWQFKLRPKPICTEKAIVLAHVEKKAWAHVRWHNTIGDLPSDLHSSIYYLPSLWVLHPFPLLLLLSPSCFIIFFFLLPLQPHSDRQALSWLIHLCPVQRVLTRQFWVQALVQLEPGEHLFCWRYVFVILRGNSRGHCNCQMLLTFEAYLV